MAPILGIWASQISGHLFAPSGAYDSIATVTVGAGGASTITFSSIPSTYTHLQIRMMARSTSAGLDGSYFDIRLNGDSGSNYSYHALFGNGSSASAAGLSSQTASYLQRFASAGASSGVFGAGVLDVLDYANTNKNKTLRTLGGFDGNSVYGSIYLTSAVWMSTSAVSSIVLTADSGGANFAQYSQFALYGVKGQ
jgi:hypothetical protein